MFPGLREAAEEFLITAAGQRNRNHLEQHVTFKDILFGMQEVLFDPQTSGGLLMAVDAVDAENAEKTAGAGDSGSNRWKNHRAGRNRNLCDTEQEMVRQGE